MSEEKLVYTLPVHKRPAQTTYYGQIGHVETETDPICRVDTNGEVYLLGTAEIIDVRMVLAVFPYNLEFEELRRVLKK